MQLYLTVLTLSSTSAVLAAVPTYGQCGGNNFTGETACEAGNECHEYNAWYSQCVPGSGSGTGSGAASSSAAAPVGTAPVPVASSAAPAPSGNASLPVGTGVGAAPTTLQTRASSAPASSSTLVADVALTSSIVVSPSTASSVAAAAPTSAAGNSSGTGENGASCSINDAFIAKGKKYIGVAADSGTLSDTTNAAIIKANFGQVTPENS